MPASPLSRTWPALVGFIAASFVAGAIGSWATIANVRAWYPGLNKPAWNPPSWLFAPVWTLLYLLMGLAAWRAWRVLRANGSNGTGGLVASYLGQLSVNALWSVLFFGLKQPAWALADIAVLWGLLVWLQVRLFRTEPLAGWLWLPYVLWVSFASALNLAIVRLN